MYETFNKGEMERGINSVFVCLKRLTMMLEDYLTEWFEIACNLPEVK